MDALRNLVGDALVEAGKWQARRQKASAARRADPVAKIIARALADYEIRCFPGQDPAQAMTGCGWMFTSPPTQALSDIFGGSSVEALAVARSSRARTDATECAQPLNTTHPRRSGDDRPR